MHSHKLRSKTGRPITINYIIVPSITKYHKIFNLSSQSYNQTPSRGNFNHGTTSQNYSCNIFNQGKIVFNRNLHLQFSHDLQDLTSRRRKPNSETGGKKERKQGKRTDCIFNQGSSNSVSSYTNWHMLTYNKTHKKK